MKKKCKSELWQPLLCPEQGAYNEIQVIQSAGERSRNDNADAAGRTGKQCNLRFSLKLPYVLAIPSPNTSSR